LFHPYGKIRNIKFIEDKVNGKSKGFAIVEFYTTEAAQQAKDGLQGA
jgi:RNA recognition motif-containing protein